MFRTSNDPLNYRRTGQLFSHEIFTIFVDSCRNNITYEIIIATLHACTHTRLVASVCENLIRELFR